MSRLTTPRLSGTLGLLFFIGCASWMPSGEQPPPIKLGMTASSLSNESVALEAILIRLEPMQSNRLEELWRHADEQSVPPDLRINLDRNGMRVGKLSVVPPLLETWIRQIGERQENSALEQAGLTADVNTQTHQLRCRANVTKEIPIRSLQNERVAIFYFQEVPKGKQLLKPRFFCKLQVTPESDFSALVRLSPQIEHGELRSHVIVRDAALRNVSERESMLFPDLTISNKLNRGEILVIGPTADRKGIGAEFFYSMTQEGRYDPVLLLIRLAQSGVDSNFTREQEIRSKQAN